MRHVFGVISVFFFVLAAGSAERQIFLSASSVTYALLSVSAAVAERNEGDRNG